MRPIDDFYKTIGYACLYKGYGDKVNKISGSEMTITLIRECYPRKLFKILAEEGHDITEYCPGIYYVTNNLLFPVQIIVISRLNKEMHSSLRVLTTKVKKADVTNFLEEANKRSSQGEKNNVDAVLQVSIRANDAVYEDVWKERDVVMCEALRELMKDEIEVWINEANAKGEAEGRAEGRAEGIIDVAKSMLSDGMSIEIVSKYTGLTEEEIGDLKC